MEDENVFGLCEGQCQACDVWMRINDLGLCEDCDGRLQRDLIRARDWDYVAAAFGLDDKGRKQLRAKVIRQYGAKNELIVEQQPKRRRRSGKQARKNETT